MSNSETAEEVRIREAYARRKPDERYTWAHPAFVFQMQEWERRILRMLRRYGFASLAERKILEVGCGEGACVRELLKWGARPETIVGVDLREDAIRTARLLSPAGVRYEVASARRLPFPDASFDLILQSTMFTSILDADLRAAAASEMLRLLSPGGIIVWYDFHIDNPKNPDVRGVPKKEIFSLFPGCKIRLERITLAPPLLRNLVPLPWICRILSSFPFLCTHYLGSIQKQS